MGRYWEWWRTWVRFSCLAPHRQLFLYSLLLYSMVNSFFCFIISFFPFSLLFDYIYGTFAMETFPLCLLFRIRRHHLRHRCDKKKTTTRIWYKTIFVKKRRSTDAGNLYEKCFCVFVCTGEWWWFCIFIPSTKENQKCILLLLAFYLLFFVICYEVEWIPIFIPDCSPAFASAPFKCWTEPNTHTLSLIDQRDSCGFEN